MEVKELIKPKSDIRRKFFQNNLPVEKYDLCLIIAATSKDFSLLPMCIRYLIEATESFKKRQLTLVVPSKSLGEIPVLHFSDEIEIKILTDEEVLGENLINKIKNKFGQRSGWVIQQFVKLQVVHLSTSKLSMILDADTFLINSRKFFDEEKIIQTLFPSMEYHKPYYDFLIKIRAIDRLPEYSFVTHHILIQKDIFRDLFRHIGILDPQSLAKKVLGMDWQEHNSSPFSLDYELYAQYLYDKYPSRFVLSRWSNYEIPNFSSLQDIQNRISSLKKRYASMSAHSYNKESEMTDFEH
jgi:hypothetical protein